MLRRQWKNTACRGMLLELKRFTDRLDVLEDTVCKLQSDLYERVQGLQRHQEQFFNTLAIQIEALNMKTGAMQAEMTERSKTVQDVAARLRSLEEIQDQQRHQEHLLSAVASQVESVNEQTGAMQAEMTERAKTVQDITTRLQSLEESARLLLLHTVINQIEQKRS